MNNFKKISAVILALCMAATVFSSCSKNENNNNTTTVDRNIITEFITEKDDVTVHVTDSKGEVSVSVSEKIVTVPVTKIITNTPNDKANIESAVETKNTAATQKSVTSAITNNSMTATTRTAAETANSPASTTLKETKRAVVDDKINEKSVGISMLTKTDPVQIGNQATIFIQGTPGKTYSIDFYETPSTAAATSSLEDKKADTNGFVSWTFEISKTCNPGKRKLIIKENSSSNYLETLITVK